MPNYFHFAQHLDPKLIAQAIKDERLAIQALVIAELPKNQRPRVLRLMESATEIVRYLATHRNFDIKVARSVAFNIKKRCQQHGSGDETAFLGLQQAAEILNDMPDRTLLQRLQDEEPSLFEALAGPRVDRKKLLNLNQKHLQKLLGQIDNQTLADAFKEANADERAFLRGGISARRGELIDELSPSDDPQGFAQIIKTAKAMDGRGELIWGGAGEWVE